MWKLFNNTDKGVGVFSLINLIFLILLTALIKLKNFCYYKPETEERKMKKTGLIILFSMVASMFVCGLSFADGPPNLYFDFNKDGKYEKSWNLDVSKAEKISVQLWIDDWEKSSFADEQLFGGEMYLYYDDTMIIINEDRGFANDTEHGGPFDPSFCRFRDMGAGKIQIVVANFNCTDIKDRLLLYTFELEAKEKASGVCDLDVRLDFAQTSEAGSLAPGGPDCTVPHKEDCGEAIVQIVMVQPSTGFFSKIGSYIKGLF